MEPDRENPSRPARDARKYDAIHRALLTGLLGNVGLKTGDFEYTGARGTKFHIFPGSGLFRGKPKWVVAGELVETTRLYARTVASIDPRWVERVAGHLVKREYAEPHWRRDTADVVAYERVTLYGLPIVARRVVHYGPIDPKVAREVFIHAALVEGEFDTDAQYFRHNRDLVREIELIEAKLRKRDVLVDAKTRFAFYDARVPQGVFNGFTFERWRRDAERHGDKRILFMSRADLMLHAAEQATPGLYPDALAVHGVRVPLSYHLEPGHPADGVTATLPLAALNQLPPEPFEWLVPGMLKEKLVALIKTMPRELRVKFVPAPDVADAVLPNMIAYRGSLFDAFAEQLGRRLGVLMPRSAFAPDELPEHLRMNFRVVDESGKQVATGRDLGLIRRELGVRARSTFADLPPGPYNRDRVTRWDFGDLPEKVEVSLHGTTLLGFPALVDEGETAALRLLDSAEAARKAHRAGVRRLFMVQLSEEVKHLARRLPRVEQLCLYYKPIGSCDDLKRDLMDAIADRATGELTGVRTQAEFIAHCETGWRRLSTAATEVTELAWAALSAHHAVAQDLSRDFPPLLLDSVRDLREQLAHLMPPRFLKTTPAAWLPHLPRFLKGIQVRLAKLLNAGLARDVGQMNEVVPRWRALLERSRKHRKENVIDPAREEYRWMLEELRISLFAQELKTSIPVSPKRLDAQWKKVLP